VADFGSGDFELDAGGLVVEPLGDEAEQTLLFEFEIAAGHAVAKGWAKRLLQGAGYVSLDKCWSIIDGLKVGEGADSLRRSGPDGVKDGVEQAAALRRGESGLGGLPGLGPEARGGEGLEGALRLMGEDAGTAFDFAGREGNAAEVFKQDGEWFGYGGRHEVGGDGLGSAG